MPKLISTDQIKDVRGELSYRRKNSALSSDEAAKLLSLIYAVSRTIDAINATNEMLTEYYTED